MQINRFANYIFEREINQGFICGTSEKAKGMKHLNTFFFFRVVFFLKLNTLMYSNVSDGVK